MSRHGSSYLRAAAAGTTRSHFLTRLIWLCVLPLLQLAGRLAYESFRDWRFDLEQDSLRLATSYATVVDRQLRSRLRGLALLAASSRVDDPGHWEDLYRQVRVFLEQFGGHVMFAEAGDFPRVVFDTRVPFASPPLEQPGDDAPAVAALAASIGAPAVGNLCACQRPQRDSVALAVPVKRDGRVPYVLTAILDSAYFERLLAEASVPDGWRVSLVDGRGAVIAHQGPPPADGERRGDGTHRVRVDSRESHWSVRVEIPPEVYQPPLQQAATILGVGIVAATLVGVFGGLLAGRRLNEAVAGLVDDSPSPRRAGIREIDAARRRLEEAAALRDSNVLLEQRVAERTAELAEARNRIAAFPAAQEARVEQERRRLAREVHDQLGQVFTAIKLIVQSLPTGVLPAAQQEALGHALDTGIASAREIARTAPAAARRLRPRRRGRPPGARDAGAGEPRLRGGHPQRGAAQPRAGAGAVSHRPGSRDQYPSPCEGAAHPLRRPARGQPLLLRGRGRRAGLRPGAGAPRRDGHRVDGRAGEPVRRHGPRDQRRRAGHTRRGHAAPGRSATR